MEETIGINLELPKEFSIKLDRHILDLKESGVNPLPSKAKLIIKFAQIGYNQEVKQ
jgi:hypothetical protein